MTDSLTDIRNKLTELQDSSRKKNMRIDGIAEEPGETWDEFESNFQRLLSEELDINDIVIKRAHRVKAYRSEKKSSKKLRTRK